MGTETPKTARYIRDVKEGVKLNNPLMGTETVLRRYYLEQDLYRVS